MSSAKSKYSDEARYANFARFWLDVNRGYAVPSFEKWADLMRLLGI
jgi:hypothetical protein